MTEFTQPLISNSTSPPFPSLGLQARSDQVTLDNKKDIWMFTTYWTLIVYEGFHLAASGYAVIVQPKNWKVSWLVVLLYAIVGGIEALFAGSMVGLIIATAYQAAYVSVTTWTPLIWAVINVLVLVLSSFSIHGGL